MFTKAIRIFGPDRAVATAIRHTQVWKANDHRAPWLQRKTQFCSVKKVCAGFPKVKVVLGSILYLLFGIDICINHLATTNWNRNCGGHCKIWIWSNWAPCCSARQRLEAKRSSISRRCVSAAAASASAAVYSALAASAASAASASAASASWSFWYCTQLRSCRSPVLRQSDVEERAAAMRAHASSRLQHCNNKSCLEWK